MQSRDGNTVKSFLRWIACRLHCHSLGQLGCIGVLGTLKRLRRERKAFFQGLCNILNGASQVGTRAVFLPRKHFGSGCCDGRLGPGLCRTLPSWLEPEAFFALAKSDYLAVLTLVAAAEVLAIANDSADSLFYCDVWASYSSNGRDLLDHHVFLHDMMTSCDPQLQRCKGLWWA